MRAICRVDADDCVCIDCIVGWSIPANRLTLAEMDQVILLEVENASGYTEDEWNNLIFTICVEPFDDKDDEIEIVAMA